MLALSILYSNVIPNMAICDNIIDAGNITRHSHKKRKDQGNQENKIYRSSSRLKKYREIIHVFCSNNFILSLYLKLLTEIISYVY